MLFLLLACAQEPLLGSPPGPERVEATPRKPYEKAEGVDVDLGWIVGQRWTNVRDQVSLQMGDVLDRRDLDPRDGQEIVVRRGRLRVKEDRVYFAWLELDRPTRLDAVLARVGIPPLVERWFDFKREWRLRWHAGFERIRVGKDPESDMGIWVEVLKSNPRRS